MAQNGYKVSVLISVYDVEPYIERCLRSLFEQTYSNLEYIVVDDCTPDNSMAVFDRVMRDYPERASSVKIIHHENHRGLAAARNTAFDHATGEFLCVVDTDDWMELDGIERMVDEQVATDADVVWGKALMHDHDGETELSEPKYKDLEEWRMCYFHFTRDYVMVNWRRIIRRSLLEQYHIRHEEGLHIGNDKQLMPLIAYYAKSFSTVDAVVYHYEKRNSHARTYKATHGGYDLFAYTREVESMRRVVKFLADKEPRYLEAAELTKLRRLLEYRAKALRNGSRKGFQMMANWIMETPIEYRKYIGWVGESARLMSDYRLCRSWMKTKDKVKELKFRNLVDIEKELLHLEAAELMKLKRLLEYRAKVLRNSSKKEFRIMVDWIMKTPVKYRKYIGWVGYETKLMSNYTASRLWMKTKRNKA